jgi:protein TonB
MKMFRSHSENLDEIVFEHRNREYGAYELRKSYDRRLIKSFFSALILITITVCIPVLIYQLVKKHEPEKTKFRADVIEFKDDYTVEKKIEIISPPPAPQTNTSADLAYEAVKDSLLVHEEIKKDTLTNATPLASAAGNTGNADSTTTNASDTTGGSSSNMNTGTSLVASAAPFDLIRVDKAPQFRGGDAEMMSFFQKNIHYNDVARRAKASGKVVASFVINAKGEVEAIKILHSLGYGLDDEVIRVLSMMPAWEPGYYQGKPVSTILNIPVAFRVIQ